MLHRCKGFYCAPHLLHPCSNVSQHEEKSLWDEIFKTREEWNQFKAGIMPMWGFRRRREESREGLVGEAKSDNTWGGIGVDALSALYNSALSWETPPSSEVQVNFNKQESNPLSRRESQNHTVYNISLQSGSFKGGEGGNTLKPLSHPTWTFQPKLRIWAISVDM